MKPIASVMLAELSRRAASCATFLVMASLLVLGTATMATGQVIYEIDFPVGNEGSPFIALDEVIEEFMEEVNARSAALAISRDGILFYSKGYGNPRPGGRLETPPDALYRIASVSKPITAALVRIAIREEKLSANDKICDVLNVDMEEYPLADKRWADVTIQHLLDHEGGWDRNETFDPMFRVDQIRKSLGLTRSIGPKDIFEYMLDQPLQFDPGSKEAYSNFGYSLLGLALDEVYGMKYIDVLDQKIKEPLGIERIGLAFDHRRRRPREEVSYPEIARQFKIDVMDAHGGLIASAPALCKFSAAYWLNGVRRTQTVSGSFEFFGSLPGTTSMLLQRADRLDVVVLLNGRLEQSYVEDNLRLQRKVEQVIDEKIIPTLREAKRSR